MEKYLVVIEQRDRNFSGYSPDVPGCVATGRTVEETMQRMKDALYFHLEDLSVQGDPLPHPQGLASHFEEIDTHAGDLFAFISVDLNNLGTATVHKSSYTSKRHRQKKAVAA